MIRNRVIYAVWLIVCALLFVLVNNVGTTILLALSLIMPIISGCMAFLVSKFMKANIDVKESNNIVFTLENTSILPAFLVKYNITCTNMLNGLTEQLNAVTSLMPKSEEKQLVDFSSKYCGEISVSVNSIKSLDVFGIFSFEIIKELNSSIVISPELFNCDVCVSDYANSNTDSDIYSMEKAGNDASETFMIRDYVAGDSVRNIHWKLSQKLDKTMVRELGLPIANDVLVLFDSAYHIENAIKPKAVDTLVKSFASICNALCDAGVQFSVGYYSSVINDFDIYDISSHSENEYFISRILSNRFCFVKDSISDLYLSCPCFKNYQHIVVITNDVNTNVQALLNFNRVNVLLLSSKNTVDLNCVYLTQFTSKNYKDALSYLEI